MTADDGKQRLTDAADAETLLRLIQSAPSQKAEPIKLWLAKIGYERIQKMAYPEIAESMQATGLEENKVAGKRGGGIAKKS